MFELDFEHAHPGALGCLIVGERIVAKWPGVPFPPKTVHEGIHIFDERIAIEFRCQQANQFFECLLKKRIVISGLIPRVRVL